MIEQIWFKQPAMLFSSESWGKFFPTPTMDVATSLNSVVRFTIYLSVLLFIATQCTTYLLAVPLVLFATYGLYKIFPKGAQIEGFKSISKLDRTEPTPENPFMNVSQLDITKNPNRGDAMPVSKNETKAKILKSFEKTADLYMDTTDLFDQSEAIRGFYTQSGSTIPTDQDAFQKFMSKGMDEPNYSTNFPSRGGKILTESYVVSKGSLAGLTKPSTSKPSGSS